jgi:DNA-binding transcriptional regulator/RsmH inhibitor MraZ
MDEDQQAAYLEAISNIGSLTRPVHMTSNSWDETTKKLEDSIRETAPFEGKWESYISRYQLIIPTDLRHLFDGGGVITVSTESHLLLFGNRHWARYNRLLTKAVGLSPVLNSVSRHIYGNMHRFSKLNPDGSIDIPTELRDYAELGDKVAIIGVIYHAEIHDKQSFSESEGIKAKNSLLERFKKMRFN